MELDFTDLKLSRKSAFTATMVLIALVLVAILGRWLTPIDADSQSRVLTWTEWLVFKQHRAYQSDVRILTGNANRLADLLDEEPDPVRVQLVVEQVGRNLEKVDHPALDAQRERLWTAAEQILAWSLGPGDKDTATTALDEAVQAIQQAIRAYEGS
jgi:hypothetical protein